MINIAICIDNNFVMQAGVFITSIIKTNKDEITIFVLSEKLSEDSKLKLLNISKDTNVKIEFIRIDLSSLPPLPLEGKSHISVATYYRILLPFILPESVSKVLYADCDMLVLDSLNDLYSTDITSYNAAASIDMFNNDININQRLKYSTSAGYFNAGMLLINLNNWRKNKISETAIDFIGQYPELCEAHDQDALNHALNGSYKQISVRYNMQLDFFCDFKYLIVNTSYYDDIIESRKKPCIIHFTGPTKPWLKNCYHPYTKLWDYFQSMTEWKSLEKKYEYSGNKLKKYLIKKTLIKLHLYKEKKQFLTETYQQADCVLQNLIEQDKLCQNI